MVLKQFKKTILFSLLIILLVGGLIMGERMASAAGGASRGAGFLNSSGPGFPTPKSFLPSILFAYYNPGPTLDPPIAHSGTPPIDFDAVRSSFQANDHDLAFSKIGFHLGPGGNSTGITDWLTALDQAGVPFFIKSVDDDGKLEIAQDIAKASQVPHTIVFRRSGPDTYDVPDYDKEPKAAAEEHWQKHMAVFDATNLDRDYVWLETINEVDKNRADWLAEFALETADLALRDGFKWAAFGWSSGEPEPEHWTTPSMLAFLRLAGQHPDQLAIALHEYSYSASDLSKSSRGEYPYLVGRLQTLYDICDRNGISRPTVLITEFGWTANELPAPTQAMEQIEWAAWLYSAYPTVRGAAIWYLGYGKQFPDIANDAQKLIAPVKEYSLANYFEYVPGTGRIDTDLFLPPPWNVP